MKKKLINNLNNRIHNEISGHNSLRYLQKYRAENFIDFVIPVIYLYTRAKKGHNKTIFLNEVIAAIGHNVRTKLKLKKDSGLAAKTGAFILYSFEYFGILQVVLGQGTKGHNTYIIQVINDDVICELWSNMDPSYTEKLPSLVPYESWKTTKHPSGFVLIKTGNQEVLSSVTPETHPIVYECVNKAQQVGWQINKSIFNVAIWALRNKTEAFNDIWELHNAEARASKIREARTVIDMAGKFLNKEFYHLYYYDFRGRKYPATAYLHEQGSDLAKGLLLRKDKKAIGRDGFFWLCVSIASNWAGDSGREDGAKTDKIPLKERADWTLDNEEIVISYATNPKVNQNWMKADKPWQFLAACNELKNFREWQRSFLNDYIDTSLLEKSLEILEVNPYDYESHLECYIDG